MTARRTHLFEIRFEAITGGIYNIGHNSKSESESAEF